MEQDAAAYFKQALRKFRSRDVKGGLDDLEESIRLDSSRWEFYWTRGAFNHRRRAYKLAETDLTQAIALCVDVKQAGKIYQRRMYCYGHLNQYDNVTQDATWLIEHGFEDGYVYWWRAWGKHQFGDIDSTIEDYASALDLLPSNLNLRIDRIAIYYRLRRYSDALSDLNYIIDSMSLGWAIDLIHLFRALALYQLGDFESSFEDYNYYQRAAGLKPFFSVQSYITDIHKVINVDSFLSGHPLRPTYQTAR